MILDLSRLRRGVVLGVRLSRLRRFDHEKNFLRVGRAWPWRGQSGQGEGLITNGGFESGDGEGTDDWNSTLGSPPARTNAEAHSGKYSMRSTLKNDGKPSEGHLGQSVVSGVAGGKTYDLKFWAKQTDHGVSYVQEYAIEWYDNNGARLLGKGLTRFRGGNDKWAKVSAAGIPAPVGATGVQLVFRFVTGAVAGGSGEVFIDDVALVASDGSAPVQPSEVKLPVRCERTGEKTLKPSRPSR